jgi:ornithine cyclodeaminase/alanine dehydrogenase-like protein (mu-crystallin family)
MRLLVLSDAAVNELLLPHECAQVMRSALVALAEGHVQQPLRTSVRPGGADGQLTLMPAYWSGQEEGFGLKAVSVFRNNPRLGLDSHQGVVLIFSARTGEPLALMNASAITRLRTAAVSAVATDVLARPDATRLAIVGTGTQAHAHLLAFATVRPFTRIDVAGRDLAQTRRFVEAVQTLVGVPIAGHDSVATAVAGADVIVTATRAVTPVLRREWLPTGVHINAVGSALPTSREIDTATMVDASLFVDRRESTLAESGDYLLAAAEAGIGPDHIRAELGDVLRGSAAGRSSEQEITVFVSLGLAVEDLAAATHLYRTAVRRDAGQWVDF